LEPRSCQSPSVTACLTHTVPMPLPSKWPKPPSLSAPPPQCWWEIPALDLPLDRSVRTPCGWAMRSAYGMTKSCLGSRRSLGPASYTLSASRPGYEIDVVVDGYRPREDFEYVKLREVQVRVSLRGKR